MSDISLTDRYTSIEEHNQYEWLFIRRPVARAPSPETHKTPPPRAAELGPRPRWQGPARPAHAGGDRAADRAASDGRGSVRRAGLVWPRTAKSWARPRAARRRQARAPAPAGRGAAQRPSADADDRGALRRPLAPH